MRPEPKFSLSAILISVACLSLTACGSHMSNAAACTTATYVQSCDYTGQSNIKATRYGGELGQYYQQSYNYQQAYMPAPYIAAYPALRPVPPMPQAVVNYAPAPAPVQQSEPAPMIETTPVYEPAPMTESAPPLTSWTPESWNDPWTEEPECPEGTIQGYGGRGCVQVAIPRK